MPILPNRFSHRPRPAAIPCPSVEAASVVLAMSFILALPFPAAAQDAGRHVHLARVAGEYEYHLRGFAPWPARSGYPCDETVGRFCLRYNDGSRMSFRPPPADLLGRRQGLLVELHAASAELPHDTLVSGRLVRLLIEAGETRAAIEAALAFTAADTTDAWSYALLGLSLFADGQLDAATRAFALASPRMDDDERARMRNAEWLLERDEREVYRDLNDAERDDYEARLWRAGDPLYLTAANEAELEHHARYVYARLLAIDAGARDLPRWDDDLEELTRRLGVPIGSAERTCAYDVRVGREPTSGDRALLEGLTGNTACEGELSVPAGLYNPDQRVYVPPRFSREPLPPPADPGATEWFYGDVADYHGFLPPTLRDIRALDHQLSRFPEGDSTLVRADVAFMLDDVAPSGAPVELGLFVLDSTLSIVAEARDTVDALGRLARGWVQTVLPSNAHAYSVEARELATLQAARARHALPAPPSGDLVVSDLVLLSKGRDTPARGDPAFVPFGSLLLERDQQATMYFELRGLAAAAGAVRYRTDLRVLEGRDGSKATPAVSWTFDGRDAEMIPVTIDVGTLPVGSGVHRLVLTVTDLIGGTTATMERTLKIR